MILAIDPGRSKFGWALGTDKGEAPLCGITPTERFREFVDIVWNEKWDLLKDWVTEKADVPILKKRVGRRKVFYSWRKRFILGFSSPEGL